MVVLYSRNDDPSGAAAILRSNADWRRVTISAGVIGSPVAVGLFAPILSYLVIAVELALVLVITLTALYGSVRVSNRAFRIIRLVLNRPEPPHSSR